jgi:hypothetical protein
VSTDRRKALIEKIRLLFNRAERAVIDADDPASVDHEAQLALETARRLMLQHGIEESELEGSTIRKGGPSEGGATTVELAMRKPARWVLTLAFVIADYFSCRALYIPAAKKLKGVVIFCGVAVATEASAYAFESVLNQIRVLSKKYKVNDFVWNVSKLMQLRFRTWEEYRTKAKSEYCYGIVVGLAKKLEELRDQESVNPKDAPTTALALSYSTVADEMVKAVEPNLTEEKPPERNWTGTEHVYAGVRDSKNVHVTKGLGAPGKEEEP